MKENKENITEELNNISLVVANLSKNNVYTIKPDYFNNLANEILDLIHQNELFIKAKGSTYIAPNGYFTNFADNLLIQIKSNSFEKDAIKDELSTIAPTLNMVSKRNLFTVPENYFNTTKATLPTKEYVIKKPVIAIRQWFKYAAAAIFIGILAVGIIQILKQTNTNITLEKEIAKTSNEEIVKYLTSTTHTDFGTTNIVLDEHVTFGLFEKTTTEEIKTYLNQQPEMVENTH